jgi:hypothetical protein
MKKYITCAMSLFLATAAISIAADNKEAIMEKEKAAWQNFKEKKADEFAALLHADFMGVYADGIQTLQKEMESMKKMEMKSFSFSDVNVVFPDADTATVTYKVAIKATVDGKEISGNYNAASVWRMQNGEWRALLHTDMKEEKPAKAPAKK